MNNLKSTIKATIVCLIFITLSSCNESKYVKYKPHYISENRDNKYFGHFELNSEEFSNTIQVLNYYEEDFVTENEKVILITKELAQDWELVLNYTSKAEDAVWLGIHKK